MQFETEVESEDSEATDPVSPGSSGCVYCFTPI